MTRIARMNYRWLVFAFFDFGTLRFLRRWNQLRKRFGWQFRSCNPIPFPASPLKGEELKKFLRLERREGEVSISEERKKM
jgi:hypothetical protein